MIRRVAILAAGETPAGAAAEVLRAADALVACDGAVRIARALGREPDFVTGDGDSIDPSDRASLGERYVAETEQETNDLAKAFRLACRRYPAAMELTILGAGGGREDHLLGNVFHLVGFARAWSVSRPAGACVVMLTNAGRFDVVRTEGRFATHAGEAFSVFAPVRGTQVTSEGLVWPLGGVDLAELWQGTLNRAAGAEVVLRTNGPILVYRAHRKV